jgi:hypothetical protein
MHAIRGGRGEARASGRKLAAWLTLFSLLLQLWVTAGHFHPEDFSALRGTAHAGVLLTTSADHGTQPASARLHEDCALCLSVQIAGSTRLTATASLSEPTVLDVVVLHDITALPRSRPPHLLFQTRAPPIA